MYLNVCMFQKLHKNRSVFLVLHVSYSNFQPFSWTKREKKTPHTGFQQKKHVSSVMFISKSNLMGNLRVLYPTPNPPPTQVPRYPRYPRWPLVDSKHGNKNKPKVGTSWKRFAREFRKKPWYPKSLRLSRGAGMADVAKVIIITYIYIYVIYSLVMSCSYVIVVSLMSLIYVYLCPVCHLCQSLIVWFLETSRNIMLMFMLDAQKKHV